MGTMKNIKWIVKDCDKNMLREILNKQLNMSSIILSRNFNQQIDAPSNRTQLKHLTFGFSFNQPIEVLSNCAHNLND